MPDTETWIEIIARWIEYMGVAVIIIGGVAATVTYLGAVARRGPHHEAYREYRAGLGRAILLGLEFLVAGDIIGTILVEPNIGSIAALGLVVLIRTFLSFSLETEIEGRPPWRRTAT